MPESYLHLIELLIKDAPSRLRELNLNTQPLVVFAGAAPMSDRFNIRA